MLEKYSKLELIILKKKILQELRNELVECYTNRPTIINKKDYASGFLGTSECEACGTKTDFFGFLQPGQVLHVYCNSCKQHIDELQEDIQTLSRKF